MGAAKQKALALAEGRTYIEVKDMRGLMFPVTETPEGDLLVTDGLYKGFKIRTKGGAS